MGVKSVLEHAVKFNPVVNGLFSTCAGIGVRALGFGVASDPCTILFVSDIGKSYSGSPRAIYERMFEDGLLDDFRVIWAFTEPDKFTAELKGCELVKLDSVAYFKAAQAAAYWVTDVNIERGLVFKSKGCRYLNTWHGSSMKTLGWDIHGRTYYDLSSVDWMCVNSEYDIDTFATAFRVEKSRFVATGLPRNDDLWARRAEESAIYKKALGLPVDKKLILYAPTWRDTVDGGESYQIAPPIDPAKWERELGYDCILAFRMHPITQKAVGIEPNGFLRDFSRFQPLNDLLLAADLLITDYSSIAFDFSILGKPVLCFGYDLAEYGEVRGLYLDPASVFPFGVQSTEDELIALLNQERTWERETPRIQAFRDRFNAWGGDATKECIDLLLGRRGQNVGDSVRN